MKTLTRKPSTARKLGLITSIVTLLGGLALGAESGLIVNQTYDPPTQNLSGWVKNAANVSRQYVTEGVAGSTAMQISGTLLPAPFRMWGQ